MENTSEKINFFSEDNFDAVVDMVMKNTRASFALEGIYISGTNFEKIKEMIKES